MNGTDSSMSLVIVAMNSFTLMVVVAMNSFTFLVCQGDELLHPLVILLS
jgi:hypothetical protein